MTLISKNGFKGFYSGEVAKKIVTSMSDNDGSITIEDLQTYKARFSQPIGINYRGKKVYTHGPPSGGGIVLLTALNVLEYFDLGQIGNNSALTYHLLAESLRRGHNNRSHHVGDPSFYSFSAPTQILHFLCAIVNSSKVFNIRTQKLCAFRRHALEHLSLIHI